MNRREMAMAGSGDAVPPQATVPGLDEALASDADLWGEAALRQPEGPSFEFFAPLLPPLRYVDAPFRHYPIALSAPGAAVKGRLISNGSAINALARQPNWRSEEGVPLAVRVGRALEPFGDDLARLEGPKYLRGYLPIVQLEYQHRDQRYAQEVFASTDPVHSPHGTLCARYTLLEGDEGKVELQCEGTESMRAAGGVLRDARADVVAVFDGRWQWNDHRNVLVAHLKRGESAHVAVLTRPALQPLIAAVDQDFHESQRSLCAAAWDELLSQGMQIEVPEPIINTAWRALLAGCFIMLNGDEMRYSAGNQYGKIYIAEGGDATRMFMLWGYAALARRMVVPLFAFSRPGLQFHQAALKLHMLAHYYGLTRDDQFIRRHRALWQKELQMILDGREEQSGMLTREKYCGDIETRVYSLNSNANCWRALRDWSIILDELGEREQAQRLSAAEQGYRPIILAAVEKSMRRDSQPPFVPVALSGDEAPPPAVWATMLGSYWGLMAPYVLGSGVFRWDSETASAIIDFLQQRGGMFMGLTAVREGESFWVGGRRTNDLYGLRYVLTLLQRDEPDRALVSFYAKLANGLTRDTFIGAEGVALRALDRFGRQMYLPPNSASNASWLWQLRCLLVQDQDMDDDGVADTLRLLFATPRRWLADGARIDVRRAPTAFGEISMAITSRLSEGRVDAEIHLPQRPPKATHLRLRLPAGWRISEVTAGGRPLSRVDDETFDLTGSRGTILVQAKVRTQRGPGDDGHREPA